MKKKFKICVLFLAMFSLTGCIKKDDYENITIYTSTYPITYIAKYLYDDFSDIKSIYPSGVNPLDYSFSNKKINDFSKGDLFIYNGLSNEKDLAATLLNRNKKMDIIDVSQGLKIKNHISELWLSPANFLMMTSNIKNNLKEYINDTSIKEAIDNKYDELKVSISEIDADLELTADNASNKRLIVVDKVFKYLEKYGFEVIAINDEDENSNTNYSKSLKYFSSKENEYLFILESTEETENVKKLVENGAKLIKVSDMYTLTEEQSKNKIDYQTIIKEFVENIKTEVR